MANFKFKAKKSLGQNFLMDQNICNKIVDVASEEHSCGVVEVGTGFGMLTSALTKKFKKVLSFEIDDELFKVSFERFRENSNVKIIKKDIMDVDTIDLINSHFNECDDIVLCANIPYYITTPIIMKFLEYQRISKIVIMVQKEAADRILASPGTRECGAISSAVRYYSIPKFNFHVSKNCFNPAPKVDSSVISFDPIICSNIMNKELFFKVLRSAFAERRKNILNSVSSGLKLNKLCVLEIFQNCNLNKNLRAENLKFDDFVKISNKLFEVKS